MDPKVVLKREFLDAAKKARMNVGSMPGEGFGKKTSAVGSSESISGSTWYLQQAHRAINQAVGRVIRHKFDYGVVLLLDIRFNETSTTSNLSKWLRPHITKDEGERKRGRRASEPRAKRASNPIL
tara:strand:+ start:172 stop:546 length:375 start_codon:yes stop_codon:yes gene_type:complete